MRLREARDLLRLQPPSRDRTGRLLRRCHDIEDLRRAARRRLPRPVFDYVDGGAEQERSLAGNLDAFTRRRYLPRILGSVAEATTEVRWFGRAAAAPIVLAPTGYTRMMHPQGELAVARAARRRGLPYVLSTVATTSIEEVAASGHADLWFQLYIWRDRRLTIGLVERAAAAGYRVLEITVDTAVPGHRVRDARHGLTVPPQLSLRALAGIAAHPAYWTRMLRSPALALANTVGSPGTTGPLTVEELGAQFDPSITWQDVAAIRDLWPGPLLLKGVIGPEDARRAVDAGVDGLHLSNHGGRQLDRAVTPVETVAAVRRAVGEQTFLLVDSGVRHGSDVATAIALGADGAAVGRPYLYGLMAAGERGVDHALALLTTELRRTMQLLGVASVPVLRQAGRGLFWEEGGDGGAG